MNNKQIAHASNDVLTARIRYLAALTTGGGGRGAEFEAIVRELVARQGYEDATP